MPWRHLMAMLSVLISFTVKPSAIFSVLTGFSQIGWTFVNYVHMLGLTTRTSSTTSGMTKQLQIDGTL
jgi:hypothetical protein